MTLGLAVLTAGCDGPDPAESEPRGGLLFGLEDADIAQIHAEYLDGEDTEFTTERLTSPFDCWLYGDLCDLVGATGAETLTGESVDMALEGVAVERILEPRLYNVTKHRQHTSHDRWTGGPVDRWTGGGVPGGDVPPDQQLLRNHLEEDRGCVPRRS